jgi:hypothetical protein
VNPQYVISRREKGSPELLNITMGAGDEKVLPVFSSEMLARGFLRSGDLGPDWRVRESHNGELASLLLGPYRDVLWVFCPTHSRNPSRPKMRCSTSWTEVAS